MIASALSVLVLRIDFEIRTSCPNEQLRISIYKLATQHYGSGSGGEPTSPFRDIGRGEHWPRG